MKPDSWDLLGDTFSDAVLEVTDYDQNGVIPKTVCKFGGKTKTAADFGCGIGASTRVLAPYVKSVIGYDFSKPLLETAGEKTKARNATYAFLDLRKTWNRKTRFDLSLCVNALISHDHALRAVMLTNIIRATKPGGVLIFVVPSLEASLRTYQFLTGVSEQKGSTRKKNVAVTNALAAKEIVSLSEGIVRVGGVPTKHFLEDELQDLFSAKGLRDIEISRVSYPWATIIEGVPDTTTQMPPWDWIVTAHKPL